MTISICFVRSCLRELVHVTGSIWSHRRSRWRTELFPSWLLKCIRPSSLILLSFFRPSETGSSTRVKRLVPFSQSLSGSLWRGAAGEKRVWCSDSRAILRVSKSARPIWSPEPRPATPPTNQELVSAQTRQHLTSRLGALAAVRLDLCW